MNDGISSNTITCITQDAKGFMWFGTRNGLNRFDGTSFKIFRSDINDARSIGSNSILSLYEDKHQTLWVGTYKGLYAYDAVHEKFSLYNKIQQGEVRSIGGDSKNNLWLIEDQVLYRINESSKSLTAYNNYTAASLAFCIAKNGIIWSASAKSIVKKYDIEKNSFTEFNINKMYKNNAPVFIQTMYPVSDTTILIATLQQVLLFNTKTLQLINVFENTAWQNNIQVHKIMQQSPSVFWFGTEDGLYILDLSSHKSQHIQKQYADPYSINDNVITDFCKDKEGNTWIGTFFWRRKLLFKTA